MYIAREDGVPREPCGVTELIPPSNLHDISTLPGNEVDNVGSFQMRRASVPSEKLEDPT